MAFFKFRFPGKGAATASRRRTAQAPKGLVRKPQAAQPESVESLRQRARHRVIGASVLVLMAVIGFPMVFDTEPRPVGLVPLEVPERNEVSMGPGHLAPIVRVPHEDSLLDNEEVVSSSLGGVAAAGAVAAVGAGVAAVAGQAAQLPQPAAAPVRAAQVQREAEQAQIGQAEQMRQQQEQAAREKAEREQAARAKAAKDKADREKAARDKAARERAAKEKADREKRQAQEREERAERQAKERANRAEREAAESRNSARDSDTGRFVIQVGSFADEDKAKAARTKLERAGISTYIQVISTRDGKRTRVRVGPFTSRAEAEAAAKRVKGLGLYAGIAEL